MEIRLLEYFMAVYEELHFTRAAEKLGISQSTLSLQIRLLEDRLGTPLFQRIGKKVYVTQAGKILSEHCERIFHELNQADIKIKELRGLLRGKLTIGCAAYHFITPPIISFHNQYPGIELSVVGLSTEETIHALLQNQVDIGIVFVTQENDQLEKIPLYTDEFQLLVSVDHELAASTSVKLGDLQSLDTALFPKKYLMRQLIDQFCAEAGFTIQPKIELSSMESLHLIARANKAAAVVTKSYATGVDDPQIKAIPLTDPTPKSDMHIVYRKGIFKDAILEAFIKQLLDTYQGERMDGVSRP